MKVTIELTLQGLTPGERRHVETGFIERLRDETQDYMGDLSDGPMPPTWAVSLSTEGCAEHRNG